VTDIPSMLILEFLHILFRRRRHYFLEALRLMDDWPHRRRMHWAGAAYWDIISVTRFVFWHFDFSAYLFSLMVSVAHILGFRQMGQF
jgi:hypothetical protein